MDKICQQYRLCRSEAKIVEKKKLCGLLQVFDRLKTRDFLEGFLLATWLVLCS